MILQKLHADLPCAFVDLEAFDANIRSVAESVSGTSLKIRVATKSIRVPELIRRVLDFGGPYQGLMCYSAQEAQFLSEQGFDDFLIAYPSLTQKDLTALKAVHQSGKTISMVVDDQRQLEIINQFMTGLQHPLTILIEPDLSLRIGSLVIGVRRSPLQTVPQVVELVKSLSRYPNLKFGGLMAYEAQVAGVGDKNPFKPLLSIVLGWMRKFSVKKIRQKRKDLQLALAEIGQTPRLYNGGGTGSLSYNRGEAGVLTELTAGSGFFCPHLFDYYSNLILRPAAFFALQVVRNPETHWYTCLGGGYVASGEPGWDRVPKLLDQHMSLSGFEATGEVQTPVKTERELPFGSPVIFRHAKAGELAERFNFILLLKGEELMGCSATYRGLNKSFF